LDAALRTLSQIECIAASALDRKEWDSDLHWVLDGIADLAHYAIEVSGEAPPAQAKDDAEFEALADDAALNAVGEAPEDEDVKGGGPRRSSH
jgi:hypothetical protein